MLEIVSRIVGWVGDALGALVKRKAERRARQENWCAQQRWQYYKVLSEQLAKWKTSLVDRDSYFIEPGSDYDETILNREQFQKLKSDGNDSLTAIRQLIGPASVFLPRNTIESLNELVCDHWWIAEDSLCTADYVSKALQLVKHAESAILTEVKNELSGSQSEHISFPLAG